MSYPWSYTKLKDFENCPLRFQHKHILKTLPFDDKNPHIINGQRKHKMLEDAAKSLLSGNAKCDPEVLHVYPLVQDFCQLHSNVQVEIRYAFNEQLKPVDYFAKDVWFRCVTDIVGIAGDCSNSLDWKTGKVRHDDDQLKLVSVSGLLATPHVNSAWSSFVWIDHREASQPKAVHRCDVDAIMNEFGGRAAMIDSAIRTGSWPAKKCSDCKWCEVKVCPNK